MICPNCEKEIENNIAQCPHCGCHFPVKEQPKQESKKESQLTKEASLPQTKSEVDSALKSEPVVIKEEAKPLPIPSVEKEKIDVKLDMESKSQESVKQNESEVAESVNTCPKCNKTINSNATFCKWCGFRIIPETSKNEEVLPKTKLCKQCGKSITATANFCKYCGLRC